MALHAPDYHITDSHTAKSGISFTGKDAGAVGGLSSGLYDDARGEQKGEVINIVQDKDGKGSNGNEG